MKTMNIISVQTEQIMRILEKEILSLGLTSEQADAILKSKELIRADLKTSLIKHSMISKFGPAIREFEITVPLDYNHKTQIDTFRSNVLTLSNTRFYSDTLISKNFTKTSNELIPGKTYDVKIYPSCSEKIFLNDMLNFLRNNNAILVSGQGLTLAHDLHKEQFPMDAIITSIDEYEYLFHKATDLYVPCIKTKSNGNIFEFCHRLIDTESSNGAYAGSLTIRSDRYFNDNLCILCFFNK